MHTLQESDESKLKNSETSLGLWCCEFILENVNGGRVLKSCARALVMTGYQRQFGGLQGGQFGALQNGKSAIYLKLNAC